MSRMFDPNLHAQAVLSLRESIVALGEGEDTQLLLDMIEGETDFFEVVDRMLAERQNDIALAEAIKKQASELADRKRRFEKRADVTKALIEQAFLVAGITEKVERPLGTLYFSKRAPKVILETEADIPTRFWDDGEPVLNGGRLKDELTERAKLLANVIDAGEDSLELAIAAYTEAFPDTPDLDKLAERVTAYRALPLPVALPVEAAPEAQVAEAEKEQARGAALSALRRDYAAVPGAVLSEAGKSLSIRVA